MNSGKMDRLITVQVRAVTQSETGGRVELWTTTFRPWAQLVSQQGGEQTQAEGDKPTETAVFRIRYAAIASNTHRVLWNSQTYNILHIAEEGRRDSLLLTCRSVLNVP